MRIPLLLLASLLSLALHAQTSFMVGTVTVNITTIAEGLDVPWDMVMGPDGHVWFTEANGHVYRMDLDTYGIELVHTVEDVVLAGFSAGLHSMAFHPDFDTQPYVYLHYMNSTSTSVVERFLYDAVGNNFGPGSGHLLAVTIPGGASHNGSRMVADNAGNFILTMGDHMTGSANVQDPTMIEGKFLRFDPLGGIPADNPIPGSYVYNWGHRNPQGLVRASNGMWYNSAHGQGIDDEVNIVLPNRNYGWPTVLGLCNTPTEQAYCTANNVVEPIHEFSTIVAPSGLDYYDHPAIPGWQNSLLVATLKGKALWQLQLDAGGTAVTGATPFLAEQFGRLRDVLVLPDGRVLVCTSNHDWAGTPVATDDRLLLLTSELSTGITSRTSVAPALVPNPSSSEGAQLRLPNGPCTVHISDAMGRIVASWANATGAVQLPAAQLTSGIYQVRISSTSAGWTLPWVVAR